MPLIPHPKAVPWSLLLSSKISDSVYGHCIGALKWVCTLSEAEKKNLDLRRVDLHVPVLPCTNDKFISCFKTGGPTPDTLYPLPHYAPQKYWCPHCLFDWWCNSQLVLHHSWLIHLLTFFDKALWRISMFEGTKTFYTMPAPEYFLWGHRGGKMHFWGDKNKKK